MARGAGRLLLLCMAACFSFPGAWGDCPSPPHLNNTLLKDATNKTFPVGSNVTYVCDDANNYVKVPDKSDTITCLEGSSWSAIEGFCERSCPFPPRFAYGQLDEKFANLNVFQVGTNLTYVCRPGYVRTPRKLMTITCLDNATWSVIPEFCERKDCNSPGELLNGNVHLPNIEGTDEPDTKFGSQATFTCIPGFRLVGRSFRLCAAGGWTNAVPTCEAVFCEKPPDLANGSYSEIGKEEFSYQSAIQYSCNKDFSLIGNSSIYCTEDGAWSGPAPRCAVVRCPNPDVANGEKTAGIGTGFYSYKESVTFACKPGFTMIGKDRVECNENGDWSPDLPTCVLPSAPVTSRPTQTVTLKPDDKEAGATIGSTENKPESYASTIKTTKDNGENEGPSLGSTGNKPESYASTIKTTKENRENEGSTGSNTGLMAGNVTLILTVLVMKLMLHSSR